MSGPGSFAGIDIGSRSIELVIFDGGCPVRQVKVPTTYDPLAQCEKLLDGMRVNRAVATGYGRRLFVESFRGIEVSTITEIQAYALGARHLFPEVRTVLDIGGQDTKVILLAPHGRVAKFEMNDRCAAGTGKFLEFMATALQIPLEAFGAFALRSDKRIQINSMCTVFAESEATSLMARGERAENIAMGLHLAIVQRTVGMLRRVGMEPPLVFAGGVAHNPCAGKLLEEQLNVPLIIPAQPDMVGAIGAALHGMAGAQERGTRCDRKS
ncbi:MAG TPA: acyl-CoA dehydratase activase [Syntrophobacter fumaroxidans]|nr:acyl-CoA dehydratase activase [Syntrophobacter fumaroxidans]